jgi:hypothetical protein
VDDFGLSPEEVAQAQQACRWVRVTPGLLSLLRPFLAIRLVERRPLLAFRIARLKPRRIYRLWERLKDAEGANPRQRLAVPSSGG